MHLKINKFLNIESLDKYSIDSSRVATRSGNQEQSGKTKKKIKVRKRQEKMENF